MRGNTNPFPSSEYALLGLLFHRPTHGYELHKMITDPEGIGMIWGVKMSNLYAQLDKLEKKGFITGTILPGETRPTRKEYHISEDGKAAFETWVFSIIQHPRDFRQEFMLRYFFLQKFQPASVAEFCSHQHLECKSWLTNTIKKNKQLNIETGFIKSVLEFRVSQIRSMVDWLEWLQSQLNSESITR